MNSHSIDHPLKMYSPLSLDEIQESLEKEHGKPTLVSRLFPSPYKTVDVMGRDDKNLFHYLEELDPERRISLLSEFFYYCYQLRHSPETLNMISSIDCYTEPAEQSMNKVKKQMKKNKNDTTLFTSLKDQLTKIEAFSAFIRTYSVHDIDWFFAMMARSIAFERQAFYTERLLWTFCSEYFEYEDLVLLSSYVEKETGIKLDVTQDNSKFPFKMGVPINAQYPVIIDGIEFTDCIEVSILQFLYMTQPNNFGLIVKHWEKLESPRKEEILDFFKMQGSKRANNVNIFLRTKWATIITKIPGLSYMKKKPDCPGANNLELNSGWTTYLRAIAFLKNDKKVWDLLSEVCAILTREKKLSTSMKEIVCDCFCELAGKEKIRTIEWIELDKDEGIRDMGEFGLDLLGRVRVSFKNVPEPIDFVMQDGHGYVQWMTLDRKNGYY